MDNNIINNDYENVKNDREYKLSGIKKEQNISSAALFLMIVIGFASALLLPSESQIISGFEGSVKEIIGALYNSAKSLLYVGVPALVLFLIKRKNNGSYIGFRRSLPKAPIAVMGFCLGVMYFANVLANIVSGIITSTGATLPDVSSGIEYNGILRFALAVVTSAVLPAFTEEIFLRGLVMGGMARYDKRTALLISSVLFGLMHLNPIQALFATISGLVLGYFVLESNSLWIGVTVHFLNNFIALIKNTVRMNAFYDVYVVFDTITDVLIFVLGIVCSVYLIKKRYLFSSDKPGDKMLFTISDWLILYITVSLGLTFMQISF